MGVRGDSKFSYSRRYMFFCVSGKALSVQLRISVPLL